MTTKESRHTPGPWYWGDSHVYSGEILPKNNPANLHDYHVIIAECSRPENARLIAAAPELLAALEWAAKNLEKIAIPEFEKQGRVTSLNNALERARAAIAKAKGDK